MLPSLKAAIKLPEDVDLLERLNNAISNSMSDNDRDVSATARTVNDTYKRTPVRMGGGCGIGGDSGADGCDEQSLCCVFVSAGCRCSLRVMVH